MKLAVEPSLTVTSLQQPLFFCAEGSRFGKVQLYYRLYIFILGSLNSSQGNFMFAFDMPFYMNANLNH